jgi:MFS transporter, FHS family, glucose/mannose:H+ symporter
VNPSATASRVTVGLIYLAAVVQGLALVTFPAASSIFASPSGFNLSGTQYGAMFIPQVALAILASALGPWFARRLGMRGVLLLGLGGDVLSMALLAASPLLIGSPSAFFLLCGATGALGLGFGATVMALNTLIEGLFPGRADGAVLALNALLGLGTALAPVLITLFTALGAWWALPLLMTLFAAVLLFTFSSLKAPLDSPTGPVSAEGGLPKRFWLYAAAALLYGVVETLNGNWATVYLSAQRHISAQEASFALTAFWVMTTAGRVIFALLDRLLPAKWVYVALPVLLAVVFQFVAHVDSAAGGIVGFAAAGLACSALLPLSISLSGAEFPRRAATMSGEMIAFYQLGYGVAAFGVGPLREIGGFAYSAAFSAGSFVALLLATAALLIVRHPAPVETGAPRRPNKSV